MSAATRTTWSLVLVPTDSKVRSCSCVAAGVQPHAIITLLCLSRLACAHLRWKALAACRAVMLCSSSTSLRVCQSADRVLRVACDWWARDSNQATCAPIPQHTHTSARHRLISRCHAHVAPLSYTRVGLLLAQAHAASLAHSRCAVFGVVGGGWIHVLDFSIVSGATGSCT